MDKRRIKTTLEVWADMRALLGLYMVKRFDHSHIQGRSARGLTKKVMTTTLVIVILNIDSYAIRPINCHTDIHMVISLQIRS